MKIPLEKLVVLYFGLGACADNPKDKTTDTASNNQTIKYGICDMFVFEDMDSMYDPEQIELYEQYIEVAKYLNIDTGRPHRPRGHVFSCNLVHPDINTWNFKDTDYFIELTQDAGITDILVTLYPEAGTDAKNESISVKLPDDLVLYRDCITEIVERYDGDGSKDMGGLVNKVSAYEIGNEQFCDTDESRAEYLEIIKQTSTAVKEADDSVTFLPGGAAPLYNPYNINPSSTDSNAINLFSYLLKNNVQSSIDAVSFHYFVAEDPMDQVSIQTYFDEWRDVIGNDIPVWVTETGFFPSEETTLTEQEVSKYKTWLQDHIATIKANEAERVDFCRVREICAYESQ